MTDNTKRKPPIDDTSKPAAADVNQPAPTEPPNPFNPENLRLSQNFNDTLPTERVVTMVPVRKPHGQEWFMSHEQEAFRQNVTALHWKEDREFYVVTQRLAPALVMETVPVTLVTCIGRQGHPFLWPIRLPGADGKDSSWWVSAREAAERAKHNW